MRRLAVALAAALLPAAVAAEDLGRLFFTPEQREALDARRRAKVPDKPAAEAASAPTLRMDGFVRRSSGRSTVWLNGEPLSEGQPETPRIASQDGRVSVNPGEGGARVDLKPGEVLDRNDGQVHDVLGGGKVTVRPAPAPRPEKKR